MSFPTTEILAQTHAISPNMCVLGPSPTVTISTFSGPQGHPPSMYETPVLLYTTDASCMCQPISLSRSRLLCQGLYLKY